MKNRSELRNAQNLETHLQQILSSGRKLVIPYLMGGDPNALTLPQQLRLLEQAGASAIEIGIPFSDPVADGPEIQAAGQRALDSGVNLPQILETLAEQAAEAPRIVMSYLNPLLAVSPERFAELAKEAEIAGLIIPDLPIEHEEVFRPYLQRLPEVQLIRLISLTSPASRIAELAQGAQGFLYAVTANGTTGERAEFPPELGEHLAACKRAAGRTPVLAGFGVSNLETARQLTANCDGVIIGSKIVKLFHQGKVDEIRELLRGVSDLQFSPTLIK